MNDRIYPIGPKFNLHVDFGMVSISHWGAFDISPYGALIRTPGQIEWFEDGEPMEITHCDTTEFVKFFRPMP